MNYRLITGSTEWRALLIRQQIRGYGYELHVEDDPAGEVGENHALLLSPDGDTLARLQLVGPDVFATIRTQLKADVAKREAKDRSAAADLAARATTLEPVVSKPQWVSCRSCGTVHMVSWLEPDAKIDRTLRQCQSCYDEYFQPCERPSDGAKFDTVANPCLDPAPEKRAQPIGSEVAAGAEPARQAPTGAAEQARAARQVGKALGAQSEEKTTGAEAELRIPLYLIDDLPGGNHRRTYDAQKLDELTALVAEHGVVEPVLVRRDGDRYQLIAGYRRREAARRAGLADLPARIRELTLEEARIEMFVENQGREDLNPMDEAHALQAILSEHPTWSHAELAKAVGKRRQEVGVLLQLTRAPKVIQQMVATREMAIDTARQFMADTANLSDFVREKVAQAFVKQKPSIRNAPDAIQWAIREVIPATPTQPAARAATVPQQVPQPDKTPGKAQQSGQNVQQTAQTAPPAASRADNAGPDVGQVKPLAPQTVTPAPKVDPAVERARALAEIGREVWKRRQRDILPVTGETVIVFAFEGYMPLARILSFWGERQALGATRIPNTMGAPTVDIPEQRVWFCASDDSSYGGGCKVELGDSRLTIEAGQHGAVEATYVGSPVYFRIELHKSGDSGSKWLRQQVVIQDGGRHIIVTGSGTAMIRAELVPKLEALVKELPGVPGAL